MLGFEMPSVLKRTKKEAEKKSADVEMLKEGSIDNNNDVVLNSLMEKIPEVSRYSSPDIFNKNREEISMDNLKNVFGKLDSLFYDVVLNMDKMSLSKEDRNMFLEKYLEEIRILKNLIGTNNKGVYESYEVYEKPVRMLEEKVIKRIIQ